jgi:hypothetical protein
MDTLRDKLLLKKMWAQKPEWKIWKENA